MDSKILLGIIAVTILGTLAVQSMMVEAGMMPIETIEITSAIVGVSTANGALGDVAVAECPTSHPFLIGGSSSFFPADSDVLYNIKTKFDTDTNSFIVGSTVASGSSINIRAHALCANFNFPASMMAVGGVLMEIDTWALFVANIGVNPVITGLVGITIAGVAGQVAWFVHTRRKKNNLSEN